jgi:glycosyltransferase involved in cell wall biosynthesis
LAPSVSVVIPAYNAEATIAQAVASALDQTKRPDEVIVACDGCKDSTARVASSLGAKVLELEKANGSVARNKGARGSQGEVLFFLDADDWWEPSKIEAHLKVWATGTHSFVIDRSTPRLSDGSRAYWTGGLDRDGRAKWYEFLSHHAWASGSSFSVTRENFERVAGFNESLNKFQDVDFLVRCGHECGPATCLSSSLTNYRLSHGPSVSKTTSQIEENLSNLFAGWPFASEEQRASFASHAYLTAAEVTPWPASVDLFKKAHWPVSRRYFWKCLYQSFRRSA